MIICAGESESFEFATPMGIGLIDTAINLTKRCIKNPPKSILFVGSAGSYGEYEIFDIVESNRASNIENSFFNANAYTPIDNIVSTASNVSRETIVNSSNYITTDDTLSKEYLSKGISLENMEFYAVLKVAKAFKIPASPQPISKTFLSLKDVSFKNGIIDFVAVRYCISKYLFLSL